MLRTRTRRAFFALFILSIVAPLALCFFSGKTALHPTETLYRTHAFDAAGVDIRSPNGKGIVAIAASIPRNCTERALVNPTGAVWRGAYLYNCADLIDQELAQAHAFFKQLVDDDYSRFYSSLASEALTYVAVGLTAWCALLIGFLVVRWISSAPA